MPARTGRKHRKTMSEINVVPFIDIMLVLLIVFMITAPLLQLGVEIELPEADAAPLEDADDPIVVNVMASGDLYLTIDGESELIDPETLGTKVAAFVRRNPDIPVLIGGDQSVGYGRVYEAMVVLQQAGVEKVGLMSDPLEDL
ncbi:MAG: protein TolR [Pseudomonadota bacterium]